MAQYWTGSATIVGNIVSEVDAALKFSQKGAAHLRFGVALSSKDQQGKESTYFVDVVCFGKTAENVAQSFRKGDRVIVFGAWDPQQWTDKETGKEQRKLGLVAEEVGASVKWATVEISKATRETAGAPASDEAPFSEEPW